MEVVGIVLASGSGQRFDAKKTPKHLTPILGTPIIVWTLNTLIKSKLFSSICVVVRESDLDRTKKIIKNKFDKAFPLIKITKGASERMASFFLGLNYLKVENLLNSKTTVGLFDANRPFTPLNQIIELCNYASRFGCACPIRPIVNGIAEIEADKIIGVPEKAKFVEFVTPEFIQLNNLEKGINLNNSILSSLVEYSLSIGINPKSFNASLLNSKLTFPEDKTYLEGLAIDNKLEI